VQRRVVPARVEPPGDHRAEQARDRAGLGAGEVRPEGRAHDRREPELRARRRRGAAGHAGGLLPRAEAVPLEAREQRRGVVPGQGLRERGGHDGGDGDPAGRREVRRVARVAVQGGEHAARGHLDQGVVRRGAQVHLAGRPGERHGPHQQAEAVGGRPHPSGGVRRLAGAREHLGHLVLGQPQVVRAEHRDVDPHRGRREQPVLSAPGGERDVQQVGAREHLDQVVVDAGRGHRLVAVEHQHHRGRQGAQGAGHLARDRAAAAAGRRLRRAGGAGVQQAGLDELLERRGPRLGSGGLGVQPQHRAVGRRARPRRQQEGLAGARRAAQDQQRGARVEPLAQPAAGHGPRRHPGHAPAHGGHRPLRAAAASATAAAATARTAGSSGRTPYAVVASRGPSTNVSALPALTTPATSP
jgi:hypothetical protein